MRMTALAALGLATALTSPASAVGVETAAIATITVDETAGACVTVNTPGTYVGEFSAAGVVTAIIQDGVVVVSPVTGARPLVGSGSTTTCIPGVWGAHSVRGNVVYSLKIVDSRRDFVLETKVCTFGGPLPCV